MWKPREPTLLGAQGLAWGWADMVQKSPRAGHFEGFRYGLASLVMGLREVETDDSKKRPLDYVARCPELFQQIQVRRG